MQENIDFRPVDRDPKTTVAKNVIAAVVSVLLIAVLAVTAGLLLRQYVVATFIVDGASMYPTLDGGNGPEPEIGNTEEELTNGDVLYLNRLAKIRRGDIVVFTPGWEALKNVDGSDPSLVKRVIAVAGDHLVIKNNVVYLNGELLEEKYVSDTPIYRQYNLDLYIPEGEIFCMGDNRGASSDSRDFGPISLDTVVGKCFMIKTRAGKLKFI